VSERILHELARRTAGGGRKTATGSSQSQKDAG
jgi:hypothetical protein